MGVIRYSCGHISGYHEPIHVKFGVWGFFIMFYWNIVMKMLKCKKENLMTSHFSTLFSSEMNINCHARIRTVSFPASANIMKHHKTGRVTLFICMNIQCFCNKFVKPLQCQYYRLILYHQMMAYTFMKSGSNFDAIGIGLHWEPLIENNNLRRLKVTGSEVTGQTADTISSLSNIIHHWGFLW